MPHLTLTMRRLSHLRRRPRRSHTALESRKVDVDALGLMHPRRASLVLLLASCHAPCPGLNHLTCHTHITPDTLFSKFISKTDPSRHFTFLEISIEN